MATAQELEKALRNAHDAGDYDIAKRLATELQSIKGNAQQTVDNTQDIADNSGFFGKLSQNAMNVYDAGKELITGQERATPETETLPDYGSMPISKDFFSLDSLKKIGTVGLPTLFAGSEETVKILKEQIPDLGVRQDDKGNYILKNPYDNKEYALKPGVQVSDIPKIMGAGLAFSPAGGLGTLATRVGASTLTQGGIETMQKLAGGEFNPSDIALAGATQAGGDLIGRTLTALKPNSSLAGTITDASVSDIPVEKLIANTKLAGRGGFFSGGAERMVQESVKPSQDILESAKRLGIEDYLQPDHVSTNQTFKELSAGIRSFPTEARKIENEGLLKVSERANNIIEELGGTNDFSTLDANIKDNLFKVQDDLLKQSEKMYSNLNKKIPFDTQSPATNVLSFIKSREEQLGGAKYLSSAEKKILSSLSPETKKSQSVLNPLDEFLGKKPKQTTELKYAPYARLDQIRKDLTLARVKKEGVFKDSDSGLLKKIEGLLLEDQKNIVENLGYLDDFNIARKTVAQRKGIEDDLTALYGKNLNKSIISPLFNGVQNLSKGDISNFSNFIKRIPDDMKKSVTVSGLSNVLAKTGRDGQLNFGAYVEWYGNLSKNSQAKNLLFSNLPKEARQTLDDFYKVSKGIYTSRKEMITTGRVKVIQDELANADNLIGKVYNVATALPKIAISEGVANLFGIPGAGLTASIVASMNAGKNEAVKQADALISSPIFIRNAKLGTPDAMREIAESASFAKFAKTVGLQQDINSKIQFLTNSAQNLKNTGESNDNTN